MIAGIQRMKNKFREMFTFLFKFNQPKTEIPKFICKMGGLFVKLSLIS